MKNKILALPQLLPNTPAGIIQVLPVPTEGSEKAY